MLAKLIKYDLKFIFKSAIIFEILLILSAILHNLTSYDYTPTTLDPVTNLPVGGDPDASILVIILHSIFYNVVIAMLISLILNSIMRVWARFSRNMYGDESYLTHTLPVSRTTLWLSKFCSLVITIFGVTIGVGISFYILSLTPSGRGLISSLGFSDQLSFTYTIALLFAIFIELVFIGFCGLTGLVIGHRANRHRTLWSLFCGFAIYSLGAVILLGVISSWAVFDPVLQIIFDSSFDTHGGELTSEFITKILFGVSFTYIAMTAALVFVDNHLLHRGVDVD